MPSTDAVVWAAISSLIIIMLGIIGYLISTGFSGMKDELRKLWEKLDEQQRTSGNVSSRLSSMEARCEERHRHISPVNNQGQ